MKQIYSINKETGQKEPMSEQDRIVQMALATIDVQPVGDENTRPTETLFAHDAESIGHRIGHPSGIQLFDVTGKSVFPASARLGRGRHILVCEDGTPDSVREKLTAAGYQNVIERP